jgi:lipoate-protein ligase A
VISGDDPRVSSGVLAAYLTISRAMIRGLALLGIMAELLPLRRGTPLPSEKVSPVCFATPSSYEVAVEGRKIIGSAQRRAHGAIMQHGSIPLSINIESMQAVFGRPSLEGRSPQRKPDDHLPMTSLREAGGRVYDYSEVVDALTRGIAETWQVELEGGQLTAAERELSAHFRATKYHSKAWTWRCQSSPAHG